MSGTTYSPNGAVSILLTGASGVIGSRVLARLEGEGADVVPVFRSPAGAAMVNNAVCTDLRAPITLRGNFDVVIHAAGAKQGAYEFNIESTRNLLTWASRTRVQHFVLVSSVGVYGATGSPEVYVEDSIQRPRNAYERSKARSEDIARDWCGEHGISLSIVRPSTVLAPKPPVNCPLLHFFRRLQHGYGWLFAGWSSHLNYIHVDDVAEACAQLSREPVARGVELILNAPISVSTAVRIAEIALGRAPSRSRFGWIPLGSIHMLSRAASFTGWKPALQLQELTSQAVFSSARADRFLARPLRPMSSVFPEMITGYASCGVL